MTTSKHNSISRLVHRSMEEIKATLDIAREISLRAALVTFHAKVDIQIMNRNGFKESDRVRQRLMKKHEIMLDFLERRFGSFWDNYVVMDAPESDQKLRDKIWVCWWQGLDNAPEIVKACVDSIKHNAGKYEVICITEKNYKDYVNFPEWIEEKRSRGIISRTILSDLLRLALLSNYGGIWIDSTFFCRGQCFDEYMNLPLWSIKRPDYLHCSVACGFFANYSLGCSYDNRWIFGVIRDFLYNYWKENDKLIDYLLTDYAIVLAQRHNQLINMAFKQILPNNKYCDELYKVLSKPYDEDTWMRLKKDTVLFKLTWKQHFVEVANGEETFYGKLLKGELS